MIYARGEAEKGQKTEETCIKLQERDKGRPACNCGKETKKRLPAGRMEERKKRSEQMSGAVDEDIVNRVEI